MKIEFYVLAVLTCLLGTTSVKAEDLILDKVKSKEWDCYVCHRNDEDFIGPSFSAVRQRYGDKNATQAVIDYLAKKTIEGGLGAWGLTPMNSHRQISKGEAKEIVTLILK